MHALYLIETGNIMDSTFSRGMVTILGINYFYVLSVYNASTIGIFVIGSLKLSVIRWVISNYRAYNSLPCKQSLC